MLPLLDRPGPFAFKLGSGNAQLRANADSIQPLHVSYQLSADKITVAELVRSGIAPPPL